MDPAHVQPSMETNEPDQPTAMQRLEQTEREVNRMAADMASVLQIGHQQQRQFQQQQQQIQQQQQQLAMIIQLLTNLTPPSAATGPAPASLPTSSVPASPPSSPASASPPVDQAPATFSSSPAPESPVLVMAAAAGAPEPKIGNPERFNGDPTQVRAFLTSCRVQFSLQPRTFATEGAKVGYVITHLTGRARLWGTAEFERQTPACATFNQFSEEMLKVFDLESTTTEASRTLMCIRQGRRTVADHSIDFRTVASRSSWNMDALVDAFLHSLADYIKDELVAHDQPSTLDEAIALAVRIDRRIQARRRERGRHNPSTSAWSDSAALPSSSATRANQLDQSEPMEIGRTSLTPAERQRRITSNLCLYCGGDGHRVATCPAKAKAHQM